MFSINFSTQNQSTVSHSLESHGNLASIYQNKAISLFFSQMNFLAAHSTSPPATASTCSNNISINSNCLYPRHREHSLDNLNDSLHAAFQEVPFLPIH